MPKESSGHFPREILLGLLQGGLLGDPQDILTHSCENCRRVVVGSLDDQELLLGAQLDQTATEGARLSRKLDGLAGKAKHLHSELWNHIEERLGVDPQYDMRLMKDERTITMREADAKQAKVSYQPLPEDNPSES